MNKLNIALFSTHEKKGGAATACKRLFDGLNSSKLCDIQYFVKQKESNLKKISQLFPKNTSLDYIEYLTNDFYINKNRSSISDTYFSFSYNNHLNTNLDRFDIINLHWVEKFLSFSDLDYILHLNKPVVWTLHDMKPFTGGCHYSSGCNQYIRSCRNCPQLSYDPCNITSISLEIKKRIFEHANLTVVSPSHWLAKKARKSKLFKNKRIVVIPNGINSNQFKLVNKVKAKKKLGIDPHAIVLSFGAVSHSEKRKGFSELVKALTRLSKLLPKNHNILSVLFGRRNNIEFPLPLINIGYIEDNEHLSLLYNAADIFILPSLEDNLPNTILEALSSQTPVVAFDTGGTRDIVNKTNGTLVKKGDIKGLCHAIYTLINDKQSRDKKGKNGRELILKKYQQEHQANHYLELFSEVSNNAFKYKKNTIKLDNYFDNLVGYTYRKYSNSTTPGLNFSKQYSVLFTQIDSLKIKNKTYIIYGHGSFGQTIYKILDEQAIAFVDRQSSLISSQIKKGAIYDPSNLPNMKFNKIIISVLGREKEIEHYLIHTLGIASKKIIKFTF